MPQSVEDFLQRCRELIDTKKVDPFTNDPDTKQTLNILAYSVAAMLQELRELEPCHCVTGPLPDHNSKYGGYVWIFKKPVQGHLLYIKLKIRAVGTNEELFVMSFHPDRPQF